MSIQQHIDEEFHKALLDNEQKVNRFVDKTNWLWVGVFAFFFLFDIGYCIVVEPAITHMLMLCLYIALFIIAHFIAKRLDYKGTVPRYVLLAPIVISSFFMTIFSMAVFDLGYVAILLISNAYYNKSVVIRTSVINIITYLTAKFLYIYIDYNDEIYLLSSKVRDELMWIWVPFILLYIILTVFCVLKAENGRRTLLDYIKEYCVRSNIQDELGVASSIQSGILAPKSYITEDFEVAASMESAKEVGGDFYDYYRKDERRIFFSIADVSGKGIPASIFAVNTNSCLRDYSKSEMTVDRICDITNKTLCERNPEKMFVTAFVGYLDISTGIVEYVNAGHNPAYILKADGSVNMIKSRPNFVLARRAKISYKSAYLQMNHGDRIFTYTDGITEARNASGEMFGNERLKKTLEQGSHLSAGELVKYVRDTVNNFAQGVERADDMTILVIDYKSSCLSYKTKSATFDVDRKNYSKIIEFVKEMPVAAAWSDKVIDNVCVCTDEIFANLDMYAFPDEQKERTVTITTTLWDNRYKMEFIDNGQPFNPLAVDNSQAVAGVKQHKKGGLGIFMIKNLADQISYKFNNKQNILTLELWK